LRPQVGTHVKHLKQILKDATGRDMQAQYKETSLAGLAVNVAKC